jgi:hypothetical protein
MIDGVVRVRLLPTTRALALDEILPLPHGARDFSEGEMTTRPLVPEDLLWRHDAALEHEQRQSLIRTITAIALSARDRRPPADILRSAWPDDRDAKAVLKAVSGPVTSSGAAALAVQTVRILPLLAPQSAALKLFTAGVTLDLAGINSVRIPNIASAPVARFVGEGLAAPMTSVGFGSTVLGPERKILILASITRELETSGPENASAVIGAVLAAAATKTLDAVAFGTGVDDGTQPAGLLHNVTSLTPATGNGLAAIAADLGAMAAAMASAGVDPEGMIIVASPRQAVSLRLLASPTFQNTVLMTTGLADRSVAAFAPQAIASALGGEPIVEGNRGAAVVHMEDTNPLPIVAGGTPAFPTTSLFQVDALGIKCTARAAWAVTAAGAAQRVDNVNW